MAAKSPAELGIRANRRLLTELWEYQLPDMGGSHTVLPIIAADLAKTNAVLLGMWESYGLLQVVIERY